MTDRSKEHGDMHVQEDHKHVQAEEHYLTSIKMTQQQRDVIQVAKGIKLQACQ